MSLLGQPETRSLRPERWEPGVGAGAEQIADDAERAGSGRRDRVCAQVAGSDDSSSVSTGLVST